MSIVPGPSSNRVVESSGLLNIHKPIGPTSRAMVDCIGRLIRKTKVGHAGTLDPLASGVLVLCVGSSTRLIEYVQRSSKSYRAVIRLGATSDTLDADGTIEERESPPIPTRDQVESVLATQVGTILQVPPQYSALKVGGKRAYDLARSGETAALEPRPVEIERAELIAFEWPRVEIEVDCGSGTYIRSIARDVGEALGCGGLIEVLTRTRIGDFRLDDAAAPEEFSSASDVRSRLIPPVRALGGMPRIVVGPAEIADLVQGRSVSVPGSIAGETALVSSTGDLCAIAEYDPVSGRAAPRRVFASDSRSA
ncbi:MAG: tRNA pseudouridine(55) synthase TruB [Isosphaeraceae bacterium]|nr:tRNA pseudouridine(55) synthase TruB [Isosphaeraceae bacterium]